MTNIILGGKLQGQLKFVLSGDLTAHFSTQHPSALSTILGNIVLTTSEINSVRLDVHGFPPVRVAQSLTVAPSITSFGANSLLDNLELVGRLKLETPRWWPGVSDSVYYKSSTPWIQFRNLRAVQHLELYHFRLRVDNNYDPYPSECLFARDDIAIGHSFRWAANTFFKAAGLSWDKAVRNLEAVKACVLPSNVKALQSFEIEIVDDTEDEPDFVISTLMRDLVSVQDVDISFSSRLPFLHPNNVLFLPQLRWITGKMNLQIDSPGSNWTLSFPRLEAAYGLNVNVSDLAALDLCSLTRAQEVNFTGKWLGHYDATFYDIYGEANIVPTALAGGQFGSVPFHDECDLTRVPYADIADYNLTHMSMLELNQSVFNLTRANAANLWTEEIMVGTGLTYLNFEVVGNIHCDGNKGRKSVVFIGGVDIFEDGIDEHPLSLSRLNRMEASFSHLSMEAYTKSVGSTMLRRIIVHDELDDDNIVLPYASRGTVIGRCLLDDYEMKLDRTGYDNLDSTKYPHDAHVAVSFFVYSKGIPVRYSGPGTYANDVEFDFRARLLSDRIDNVARFWTSGDSLDGFTVSSVDVEVRDGYAMMAPLVMPRVFKNHLNYTGSDPPVGNLSFSLQNRVAFVGDVKEVVTVQKPVHAALIGPQEGLVRRLRFSFLRRDLRRMATVSGEDSLKVNLRLYPIVGDVALSMDEHHCRMREGAVPAGCYVPHLFFAMPFSLMHAIPKLGATTPSELMEINGLPAMLMQGGHFIPSLYWWNTQGIDANNTGVRKIVFEVKHHFLYRDRVLRRVTHTRDNIAMEDIAIPSFTWSDITGLHPTLPPLGAITLQAFAFFSDTDMVEVGPMHLLSDLHFAGGRTWADFVEAELAVDPGVPRRSDLCRIESRRYSPQPSFHFSRQPGVDSKFSSEHFHQHVVWDYGDLYELDNRTLTLRFPFAVPMMYDDDIASGNVRALDGSNFTNHGAILKVFMREHNQWSYQEVTVPNTTVQWALPALRPTSLPAGAPGTVTWTDTLVFELPPAPFVERKHYVFSLSRGVHVLNNTCAIDTVSAISNADSVFTYFALETASRNEFRLLAVDKTHQLSHAVMDPVWTKNWYFENSFNPYPGTTVDDFIAPFSRIVVEFVTNGIRGELLCLLVDAIDCRPFQQVSCLPGQCDDKKTRRYVADFTPFRLNGTLLDTVSLTVVIHEYDAWHRTLRLWPQLRRDTPRDTLVQMRDYAPFAVTAVRSATVPIGTAQCQDDVVPRLCGSDNLTEPMHCLMAANCRVGYTGDAGDWVFLMGKGFDVLLDSAYDFLVSVHIGANHTVRSKRPADWVGIDADVGDTISYGAYVMNVSSYDSFLLAARSVGGFESMTADVFLKLKQRAQQRYGFSVDPSVRADNETIILVNVPSGLHEYYVEVGVTMHMRAEVPLPMWESWRRGELSQSMKGLIKCEEFGCASVAASVTSWALPPLRHDARFFRLLSYDAARFVQFLQGNDLTGEFDNCKSVGNVLTGCERHGTPARIRVQAFFLDMRFFAFATQLTNPETGERHIITDVDVKQLEDASVKIEFTLPPIPQVIKGVGFSYGLDVLLMPLESPQTDQDWRDNSIVAKSLFRLNYRECPRGFEPDPNDIGECVLCQPGYYSEPGGTCTPCPAGTHVVGENPFNTSTTSGSSPVGCAKCPPFTYASRIASDHCLPCYGPETVHNGTLVEGLTRCTECSDNTYSPQPFASGRFDVCIGCPIGASCRGTDVLAERNVWLEFDPVTAAVTPFQCRVGDCHQGSHCYPDSSLGPVKVRNCCAKNRLPAEENPLCRHCLPGYYMWGTYCVSCTDAHEVAGNIARALAVFAMLLCGVHIVTLCFRDAAVRITIFHVHVITMLGTFYDFRSSSYAVRVVLGLFEFDLTAILGGYCYGRLGVPSQILLSLLKPQLLGVLLYCLLRFRCLLNRSTTFAVEWQAGKRTLYHVLLMCHSNIVRICFDVFFPCKRAGSDGPLVMTLHPSVECGSSEHSSLRVWAVVFVLLYCVYVPYRIIATGHRLLLSRKLFNPQGYYNFGVVMEVYRPEVWYAEVSMLLRRTLFVCVISSVTAGDQRTGIFVSALLVVFSAAVFICTWPYRQMTDNILEVLCCVAQMSTLVALATVKSSGSDYDDMYARMALYTSVIVLMLVYATRVLQWRYREALARQYVSYDGFLLLRKAEVVPQWRSRGLLGLLHFLSNELALFRFAWLLDDRRFVWLRRPILNYITRCMATSDDFLIFREGGGILSFRHLVRSHRVRALLQRWLPQRMPMMPSHPKKRAVLAKVRNSLRQMRLERGQLKEGKKPLVASMEPTVVVADPAVNTKQNNGTNDNETAAPDQRRNLLPLATRFLCRFHVLPWDVFDPELRYFLEKPVLDRYKLAVAMRERQRAQQAEGTVAAERRAPDEEEAKQDDNAHGNELEQQEEERETSVSARPPVAGGQLDSDDTRSCSGSESLPENVTAVGRGKYNEAQAE
ncbi:MAG: hypothetical protein MHM6MM_000657 [Cercozoa sp. M6MM]